MRTINRRRISFLGVCGIFLVAGCVQVPNTPPVAPNFVFVPPSSVAATHSDMNIGILAAIRKGSLLQPNGQIFVKGNINPTINQMMGAFQTDLEKMIIAKGFTSSGTFPTIDEMTYQQKIDSELLLRPTFTVEISAPPQIGIIFQRSQPVTISGYAVLEMIEPMSREKVWIKRLQLDPITEQILTFPITVQTVRGPMQSQGFDDNGFIHLLNSFYAESTEKLWRLLDWREIVNLRHDADVLKRKTQYRGGARGG